jgi:hypothetical protein
MSKSTDGRAREIAYLEERLRRLAGRTPEARKLGDRISGTSEETAELFRSESALIPEQGIGRAVDQDGTQGEREPGARSVGPVP